MWRPSSSVRRGSHCCTHVCVDALQLWCSISALGPVGPVSPAGMPRMCDRNEGGGDGAPQPGVSRASGSSLRSLFYPVNPPFWLWFSPVLIQGFLLWTLSFPGWGVVKHTLHPVFLLLSFLFLASSRIPPHPLLMLWVGHRSFLFLLIIQLFGFLC